MLGYDSHEERFYLRSREFNIIYESVARCEISHGAFYGVFLIQVCSFNLRDIWDFGHSVYFYSLYLCFSFYEHVQRAISFHLTAHSTAGGPGFFRRQKVQHNLACGPLILLYITHPIYSWNSNTTKCVVGQTFLFRLPKVLMKYLHLVLKYIYDRCPIVKVLCRHFVGTLGLFM